MGLPQQVSAKDLASVLGLTTRRLQQLAKQGVLAKTGHGKYELGRCVQAYVDWKTNSEIDRATDSSSADEQVKLERARKLRRENDEGEHRLIQTSDATAAVEMIVGGLRTDLSAVPARVTTDVAERRRIENEIDTVLGKLADRFEKVGEALQAGRDPDEADQEGNN